MRFSIITPVYNCEKFISNTIESVINQTFSDWEMIVVNNGSTDNTKEEVEKFTSKDLRIKLINCDKNSGSPARPRNIGIRASQGECISFLDADDLFYPEKLEEANKFFENFPQAELICHGEAFVRNGELVRNSYYGPRADYKSLLFHGNSLSTSAVIMRRNCIEKIGFFSENLELRGFEDYEYWLRASKVCKIMYLRKILGFFTINENTEASQIAKNFSNALHFLDDQYSRWQGKNIYYSWLIRKRKSQWLKVSGRELMHIKDFKQAFFLFRKAIIYDPFNFKSWVFMFISFVKANLTP